MIDYYRLPGQRDPWEGAFNGQKARCDMVSSLMQRLAPRAIVETGTYKGSTAEFLAGFGVPVYTVEGHPREYGFARARLHKRRNVTVLCGDSRAMLVRLFDGPLRSLTEQTLLFYLDAHWKEDLPLAEELEIIFARVPRAVVLIDDFAVPGEPGYAYDDYGPGKTLIASYIDPVARARGLAAFYPSTPAAAETGARRGSVVLVADAVHGACVAALPLLRPAP